MTTCPHSLTYLLIYLLTYLLCFLFLLLCTLLYHYTIILECCLIIRLMADTPRELDRVNCILLLDDVLASGPRTPWSPIREWTRSRQGPIAATRLLDLEDDEFERPAENSGQDGATITLTLTLTLGFFPNAIFNSNPT